jgi:LPXTG-motif cell wall-anchored protein
MIEHSQSGPFGWWEGVDYPNVNSPWNIDHAAGGGGSDQHMWGQAMGTNVLFDSLLSLKSDGSVIVGRGVPADWVADGQKVALDNFPVSDGGRIGYTMEAGAKSVKLSFTGDLDKVPSISVQLIALKDNIASVDVKGAVVDATAGTVTLPGGTKSVTIRLGHVQEAPVATKKPSITGQPTVGSTLTAHPGTWSVDGLTFTYEWLRDGKPVTSATPAAATAMVRALAAATPDDSRYVVTQSDLGSTISVRVTASRAGYENGTATSDGVTIVAAGAGSGGSSDGAPRDPGDGILARTGSSVLLPLALLGLAMIAAGAAFFMRRRRARAAGASAGRLQ